MSTTEVDQPGSTATSPGRRRVIRPSAYVLVVAALMTAQVALRTWAAAGGWFYWDDFWWHDIVATTPLVEASTLSLGGHFSPLTYLPYWLLTHWFPFGWGSRVVVMIVTLVGIDLGVLAVVRRLWSSSGPRLAVFSLWCFSALAAPSWLWYSQFSMIGALLLTSTWCLWAYLRAMQQPSGRATALALTLLVVALLAQERMLALSLVLGLFLILVVRWPARAVLYAHRGLWMWSGLLLIVYILVYQQVSVDAPGSRLPPWAQGMATGWNLFATSFLPGFFGGPFQLDQTPVLARAQTAPVVTIVCSVLLLSVVLSSLALSRRAVWSWLVLTAGVFLDVVLVVLGRAATLQGDAAGEWRYFSDLAVLAPLLVVSAFVAPGQRVPAVLRRRAPVAWSAVALMCIAGIVTTVLIGVRWRESTAKPFVTAAAADIHAHPDAVLMDRVLPEAVVNPVLGVQRRASRVFSSLSPVPRFDVPTNRPLWIGDDGRLVPGGIEVMRVSPGKGSCPYPIVGTTSTRVPLPGKWQYDWGIRIDYEATDAARLVVRAGSVATTVNLVAGRGRVYVPLPTLFDSVELFGSGPEVMVCIRTVSAGPAGAADEE